MAPTWVAGQSLASFCALGGIPARCHGGTCDDKACRAVNDLVLAKALAVGTVDTVEHRVDLNKILMPMKIGGRRRDHAPLQVTLRTESLHNAKIVASAVGPSTRGLAA